MSTTIARLYRAAASLGKSKAVPGPSGGWYFVENPSSADTTFGLVTSAGTISWQTEISFAGSPAGEPYLVANATHVVLIYCYIDTGNYRTVVQKYDSSGTLVWDTLLPLRVITADAMEMSSGGSVYIGGRSETSTESLLAKLNNTTGAIDWVVNLRHTSSDAAYAGGPIGVLSGGDPVIIAQTTAHTTGFYGYLQRLDASTGAVTWSQGLVWNDFVAPYAGLAISPSDEIYAWGRPYIFDIVDQIDLIKLDDSGGTTWTATIASPTPDAVEDHDFKMDWQGKGVATAAGVHIPTYFGVSADDSIARVGHVFAPAAGSIGAGLAKVITYTADAAATEPPRMSAPNGELAFAYQYSPSTYAEAWLVRSTESALEDTTVGDVTRQTFDYDMQAVGGYTVSATYTRQSAPSFTALTALADTPVSGTVSITSYGVGTTTVLATSVAPATAFGLPALVGITTGAAPSTTFGTTGYIRVQPATSVAPTTSFGSHFTLLKFPATGLAPGIQFGTPGYNLNLSYAATGLVPATTFGEAWALRTGPRAPNDATSVQPDTNFGLPVATSPTANAATGFTATAFGTPAVLLALASTGDAPATAFGTAKVTSVRAASGFLSENFGLPTIAQVGTARGAVFPTLFGIPTARPQTQYGASGFGETFFGLPSAKNGVAMRGARFRTQFGTTTAERTTP
jgi:hypothetical protein